MSNGLATGAPHAHIPRKEIPGTVRHKTCTHFILSDYISYGITPAEVGDCLFPRDNDRGDCQPEISHLKNGCKNSEPTVSLWTQKMD